MTDNLRDAAQLLPCPFCGGKPAIGNNRHTVTKEGRHIQEIVKWETWVNCPHCRFAISSGCIDVASRGNAIAHQETLERATQMWNTRAPLAQQDAQAVPTVLYRAMPESNGRTNWTASLVVQGKGDFTLARSEYPHRVRYEADHVRWLIGELDKEPFILDYDADEQTPCHLCKGTGERDGKPCWGLNFKGTVHPGVNAAPTPPTSVCEDAERYRTLREQDWFNNTLAVVVRPKESVKLGYDCPNRERLDEMVDALRQGKNPG